MYRKKWNNLKSKLTATLITVTSGYNLEPITLNNSQIKTDKDTEYSYNILTTVQQGIVLPLQHSTF